jgi:GT2 family glycosyltransferase
MTAIHFERDGQFCTTIPAVAPAGLSVVVPTRDTHDITLRCLGSVMACGCAVPLDVIVVDDGSLDGTSEDVRRRFPDVRVHRHDRPLGFTSSANAGLRLAAMPLVLLLNSDTEVEAGAFDALIAAFDADPRLGIVGAQLLYPDGRGQWSGGAPPDLVWLFAESSGLARAVAKIPGYRLVRPLAAASDREVEWVTGAALAMRRDVWQDVGPLDTAFRVYGQDLDFCLRARDRGWRVRIVARCRVRHHFGATIARGEGSVGRQVPQALWTDLVRWAEKRRGPAYARRAGRAISAGARLRVFGRRLFAPAVPATLRDAWRGETRQLQVALAALRGGAPASRG